MTLYLLLWGPNWSSDPVSGGKRLLPGVASTPASASSQQDTWSTITDQYTDGTGHPSFNGSVYAGAFQDTSTPPSGVDPGTARGRIGRL